MRKGFTLIELLVVIAIIAILAAILFPVFAKAREKARQSSCSSNVKQIMLGLLQYCQDYDETTPGQWKGIASAGDWCYPNPTYGGDTAGGTRLAWSDLLMPYIKNTQIFNCPSHPGGSLLSPTAGIYQLAYGYGIGTGQGTAGNCPDQGTGSKIATYPSPSTTPKIADSWAKVIKVPTPANACSWVRATDLSVAGTGGGCNGPAACHNMGANVGFMDGHVKWMSGSALLGGNASGLTW
ncbi:MAG: DUF1559 domain-containing protein [Armatimonadota bacterium]